MTIYMSSMTARYLSPSRRYVYFLLGRMWGCRGNLPNSCLAIAVQAKYDNAPRTRVSYLYRFHNGLKHVLLIMHILSAGPLLLIVTLALKDHSPGEVHATPTITFGLRIRKEIWIKIENLY